MKYVFAWLNRNYYMMITAFVWMTKIWCQSRSLLASILSFGFEFQSPLGSRL